MSNDVGGTETDGLRCSLDVLYDVLAHGHRRYVLTRLSERTEPVRAVDLALEIAAWEADQCPDAVSPDARRRVHSLLVHSHLPKMADADLVEYDADAGTVAVAESAPQVDDLVAKVATASS